MGRQKQRQVRSKETAREREAVQLKEQTQERDTADTARLSRTANRRHSGPPEPPPKPENFRGLSRELGSGTGLVVQPKLTLGQPNDKYEREADKVAVRVVEQMNRPEASPPAPREGMGTTVGEVRRKLAGPVGSDRGVAVSSDLEAQIDSARGGGKALDPALQQSMGRVMGADLSGVRVHADARSDRLNQTLQAKAFTTGRDVFFKRGAYQPGSREGQELIAHELTHTMQQNREATQTSHSQGQARETQNVGCFESGRGDSTIQRKLVLDPPTGDLAEQNQKDLNQLLKGSGRKVSVNEKGEVKVDEVDEKLSETPGYNLLKRMIENSHEVKIGSYKKEPKAEPLDQEKASMPGEGTGSQVSIPKILGMEDLVKEEGELVMREIPRYLVLGHELIHADRSQRGYRQQKGTGTYTVTGSRDFGGSLGKRTIEREWTSRLEELETVGIPHTVKINDKQVPHKPRDKESISENDIRQYFKVGIRVIYEEKIDKFLKDVREKEMEKKLSELFGPRDNRSSSLV